MIVSSHSFHRCISLGPWEWIPPVDGCSAAKALVVNIHQNGVLSHSFRCAPRSAPESAFRPSTVAALSKPLLWAATWLASCPTTFIAAPRSSRADSIRPFWHLRTPSWCSGVNGLLATVRWFQFYELVLFSLGHDVYVLTSKHHALLDHCHQPAVSLFHSA